MTNEEVLTKLRQKNPDYQITKISQASFKNYGNLLAGYDLQTVEDYFKKNVSYGEDGNSYNPSNPELEKLPVIQKIGQDVYAGMEIAAGECTGQAQSFSAVEFHQGSEVNLMLTDVVMVLGKRSQIKAGLFDAAEDAKLFFIPAGSIVEMYSDTLHYSPIKVHPAGFKAVVIVLRGTNQPLPTDFESRNKWIVKKNKFQAAHAVRKDKLAAGIVEGVSGKLIKLEQI
ncbi:DUF4867 family protein [Liquorilactobacillus sicerae]|uniref:DUF4867 family protein n=1 Tax=Liquorilactobacillus sicerae TaxID=1416943 RepID=UPI002480440F|nr:DUF4867 family protein [Liquorilactobacillus sicerae]